MRGRKGNLGQGSTESLEGRRYLPTGLVRVDFDFLVVRLVYKGKYISIICQVFLNLRTGAASGDVGIYDHRFDLLLWVLRSEVLYSCTLGIIDYRSLGQVCFDHGALAPN